MNVRLAACGFERDVAHLVADQQRDPLEPVELLVELAVALCVGEERDPLGCCLEDHAVTSEAGADPERDRDVRLAGPGRVGVELLMLLMFCRSGCGWSARRASCGMSSLRCWAGGLRRVRRR